ncbi:hypothetical protein GE061_004208 [Apolygus lucorum]|uniref:CUE domain-containing protein n=1 Tax=Apolygus lucorum TaxID=248454 RepID=A0A8S9WYQ1_APOLU|nr:hypothetical protein GE061_004208 [Apolygus lucorum]
MKCRSYPDLLDLSETSVRRPQPPPPPISAVPVPLPPPSPAAPGHRSVFSPFYPLHLCEISPASPAPAPGGPRQDSASITTSTSHLSSMNQFKKYQQTERKCEPRTGKRHVTLEDSKAKDRSESISVTHENVHRGGRNVPFMGASAVQSNHSHQPIIPETVQKIRAMFPTVPETHIKALLLKYHGRDAVVVSALQVEKFPVATPGPYTPPPARQQSVRVAPPLACRPQPKPHSPKMKLRYLKSVFPVVEETVLLDTLCSADNNVTHATERLLHLGFNKRDTPPPRVSLKKKESEEAKDLVKKPTPPTREKTPEEKSIIKERVCRKHNDVAERVVSIALESASYNEDTAETILSLMVTEKPQKTKESTGEVVELPKIIKEDAESKTEAVPIAPHSTPQKFAQKKRLKGRPDYSDHENDGPSKNIFQSPLLIKPNGPDATMLKGPDETLLLEDYVPWIGAKRGLARGANKSLVRGPAGATGPNPLLRRGPSSSLAKGSIYSNFSRGQRGLTVMWTRTVTPRYVYSEAAKFLLPT